MMNYSTFRLQNQGGRPAIFWEKETIPKKDRKFGYKNNNQRFPIRRYPNDKHHIDTDLVSLTPDEPPPPPKPAKNFIKRNKEKVASKKPEPPSTVTLTQEQLNAILRSVGKVAGGSENAVKITVDKHNDTKEIVIESPRRHEHDDDGDSYDDRRERRRKKRSEKKAEDQTQSIYSLLDNDSKPKASSLSDSEGSDTSIELRRLSNKRSRHRKDRKSRRRNEEDEEDEDDSRDKKTRRNKSKTLQDDIDREIENLKRRNRSKQRDEEYDSDIELKEDRIRRTRSKRQDSDIENDDDYDRDFDRKDRARKSDRTRKGGSKERTERKSLKESLERGRDIEIQNDSFNKDDEELLPSPREKIGLPMDLSWRHMTKAERRRLEAARQKLVDEEEKKEEDRIKQLNARFDPDESFKRSPQRHQQTRSDQQAVRHHIGRDTETSNYTDGNRRGRRSRSPSDQRSPDRSPDLPSYTTPDTSPKGPVGIPRRHMTLAEKKRLEWEKERVESVALEKAGNYDPWGKPGAGAPLRTRSGHVLADYKGRQDQVHHQQTIPEEGAGAEKRHQEESEKRPPREPDSKRTEKKKLAQEKVSPPAAPQHNTVDQGVPVTMRSSFALGQAVPDYDRLTSAKERERKKWLADLEKQIEEKRKLERRQPEVTEDFWASKLGQSHRPAPFPEQPKETSTAAVDPFNTSADHGGGGVLALESNRATSAPENQSGEPHSYIRGQNVPMDPVTRHELEEKRKQYLEHQAAVRAQMEEKEQIKRMERERKIKEDMEEERKLQQERDMLKKQFEMEQQKIKQKEQQRQAQVNQLKAAMDEAQAKALQEKYQRKMQHLEAGGHDTSKLREHLEAKVSPRDADGMMVVEPGHVPGLDLSTSRTHAPAHMPSTRRDQAQTYHGQGEGHFSQVQGYRYHGQGQMHEPYVEDRVLTPSRYRHPSKTYSDPGSPRREFGTQTVDDISHLLNPRLHRDDSEVNIEYRYERGKKVRVISAPKETVERRSRKPKEPPQPSSYQEPLSPHDHHHEVRKRVEMEEERRKKKLEQQRRKGPVKPGSRPRWGYKNTEYRKPKKQSERDPFYEQKKRESDARRLKREQQLLAMVEANKPVIPDYYVPPPRSRSRSHSPFSDIEIGTPRESHPGRRSKSHSPHRLVPKNPSDYSDGGKSSDRHKHRNQSRSPPPRDQIVSPQESRNADNRPSRNRQRSPPVPALRHKPDIDQNADLDPKSRRGGKYGDADPLDVPVQNGDFVPFTRTIDVLDPTKAEEPLPLSREATRVANARRAYYEGLHPEKFGNRQYVFQDKHRVLPGTEDGKNPLMNPSLVLDHPTSRQDQILVQLSTLKQSLMQRQRELETFSPTDLVRMETDVKG